MRERERRREEKKEIVLNKAVLKSAMFFKSGKNAYLCRPRLSQSPPAHCDQSSRNKMYWTYVR